MSIDCTLVVLWSALGVWCIVWLNVVVGIEPDTRSENEKFDDMAW